MIEHNLHANKRKKLSEILNKNLFLKHISFYLFKFAK